MCKVGKTLEHSPAMYVFVASDIVGVKFYHYSSDCGDSLDADISHEFGEASNVGEVDKIAIIRDRLGFMVDLTAGLEQVKDASPIPRWPLHDSPLLCFAFGDEDIFVDTVPKLRRQSQEAKGCEVLELFPSSVDHDAKA